MTPPSYRQHLVLLGAERAQLHLMRALARQRPANLAITLVTPQQCYWDNERIPAWVAGRHSEADVAAALAPWVQACGARHLEIPCAAVDAVNKVMTLADGQTLAWDWLSINADSVMDRAHIEHSLAGAREHALFLHPLDRFVALWPQLLATLKTGPAHWAVVGNSLTAMELAMAAAHVLRAQPGSHVTLIAHPTAASPQPPVRAQHLLDHALREQRITRIQARCVGFAAGEVLLDMGGRVQCDAAVLADGHQPPAWVASSGLTLDETGAIVVQATHQSVHHPHVFAAGALCSCPVAETIGGGRWAQGGEASFAASVHAAVNNQPLISRRISPRTLRFFECGNGQAIVSWGDWAAKGRWAAWWHNRINRRLVANYTP